MITGSQYTTPDGATGDDRIYGRFEGQTCLGTPCAIICERIEDCDPRAVDMLGQAGVFRRGGVAIHISGKNPYGQRSGPGYIRALAMYAFDWGGRKDHPSGIGANGPEPACIHTWDAPGERGCHFEPGKWQHHAFYGGCDFMVTAEGLLRWAGDGRRFTPQDVCEAIDALRPDSISKLAADKQHISAVRRLLEAEVDVSNTTCRPAVLRRAGRWTYYWER